MTKKQTDLTIWWVVCWQNPLKQLIPVSRFYYMYEDAEIELLFNWNKNEYVIKKVRLTYL